MPMESTEVRKITISLPNSLVEFADREAARLDISRSGLIARVLSEVQASAEDMLAEEGYRFYAQEATEFAQASAHAAAEAMGHAG